MPKPSLKKKIIKESLKLFSLKGFESTSIHDILSVTKVSRGGFYCHFASKEELFYAVLEEGRRIWRKRNLDGLDEIDKPTGKLKRLLENFRDRYLLDAKNFPGGCIFVTFVVELNDQRPHLSAEVQKGFIGLKKMIKRLLEESIRAGELAAKTELDMITEVLFNGMLGASISFNADKSSENLKKSINALIYYLENLKS